MKMVTLFGLLVGLFAYTIAFPDPARRRFDIYLGIYAIHLFMTVAYWLYTYERGQDAFMYYFDPYNFYGQPWRTGTFSIVHFVQAIKSVVGGSYLDYFFLFQAFGMMGIALLIRSLGELADSLGIDVPPYAYLLLCLPDLHYFSSAIGKDAPMFMAMCMSVWGMLQFNRRMVWIFLALLIMVAVRPHIAGMAGVSVLGSILLSRQVGPLAKMIGGLAGVGLLLVAATKIQAQFSLASLDPDSVSQLIERTSGLGERYGTGANLQSLDYPLKVLSLLFRPMFFDAVGFLGLVVSVENVGLAYIVGYLVYYWRTLLRLTFSMNHVRYALFSSMIIILFLSAISYNVGLGLRQKMMAVPGILMLYATIYLYRRYLRMQGQQAAMQQLAYSQGSRAAIEAVPVSRLAESDVLDGGHARGL